MNLINREKASHFYLRDGQPFYEVENKSKPGEMRPATVRDARQAGAFPSVTNALGMYGKAALTAWLQEQAIYAALTLPRKDGETTDEFAKRVVQDMEEQQRKARELGSAVHDGIACILTGQGQVDPLAAPYLEPFREWAKYLEVFQTEFVVVNEVEQYAGRCDFYGKLCGEIVIADFKTQNRKKGKATFYPDWPLQTGAYREPLDKNAKLASVVIATDEPAEPEVRVWYPDDHYYHLFRCCLDLWRHDKNYPIL